MGYDPERHRRRSIRLRGYDYAQGGVYFVTVCVQGRACVLGEVVDGEVRLSGAGEVVARCWADLPRFFPTVDLDAWVVMPNHFHGIVFLTEPEGGDTGVSRPPLATVVGAFKSFSARGINRLGGATGGFWQRNYWERVVRGERELARFRGYIEGNPARWEMDSLHPEARNAW